MRIAIMQPYIFPYIGYFQLIMAVDKFVLLDDVHYINKGWINRNALLVNGKINRFTIPLHKASQNNLINETNITTDLKWKRNLLRTIECAYKKAPYFNSVFPLIVNIISLEELNISKFVYYSLKKILNYLEVDTQIIPTSAVYNNRHLTAQNKIIDICLKEKARFYLNAIGGKELYKGEAFDRNQLKLLFVHPVMSSYSQLSTEFVPGLSIIDVMMHNAPKQVYKLLQESVVKEALSTENYKPAMLKT